MYKISKVYKEDGKVQWIRTGIWPNIKSFNRIDIDGVRYFKCASYGKVNLYQPINGYMKFVGKI